MVFRAWYRRFCLYSLTVCDESYSTSWLWDVLAAAESISHLRSHTIVASIVTYQRAEKKNQIFLKSFFVLHSIKTVFNYQDKTAAEILLSVGSDVQETSSVRSGLNHLQIINKGQTSKSSEGQTINDLSVVENEEQTIVHENMPTTVVVEGTQKVTEQIILYHQSHKLGPPGDSDLWVFWTQAE